MECTSRASCATVWVADHRGHKARFDEPVRDGPRWSADPHGSSLGRYHAGRFGRDASVLWSAASGGYGDPCPAPSEYFSYSAGCEVNEAGIAWAAHQSCTGAPGLPDLLDLACGDSPEGALLRRFLAGRENLDRQARIAERDAALGRALAALVPSPTWEGCVQLAQAISRFESRVWPRVLAGARAQDLGPMDAELLRARLAGPLPATPRQLWNLLKPAAVDVGKVTEMKALQFQRAASDDGDPLT
jgi:hypothetical protein